MHFCKNLFSTAFTDVKYQTCSTSPARLMASCRSTRDWKTLRLRRWRATARSPMAARAYCRPPPLGECCGGHQPPDIGKTSIEDDEVRCRSGHGAYRSSFGSSLCANPGHRSSINSRIGSEPSLDRGPLNGET